MLNEPRTHDQISGANFTGISSLVNLVLHLVKASEMNE